MRGTRREYDYKQASLIATDALTKIMDIVERDVPSLSKEYNVLSIAYEAMGKIHGLVETQEGVPTPKIGIMESANRSVTREAPAQTLRPRTNLVGEPSFEDTSQVWPTEEKGQRGCAGHDYSFRRDSYSTNFDGDNHTLMQQLDVARDALLAPKGKDLG